jgi:hypothetical protein
MAEQFTPRVQILDNLGNVHWMLEGEGVTIQYGNRDVLVLDASDARLKIGGEGLEGCLVVRDEAGRNALLFDASTATLYIGTHGNEGDLIIRDEMSRNALHFDASTAALYVGAEGNEGDIYVRNDDGETTLHVDGNEGDLTVNHPFAGLMREVMKFDASQATLSIGCLGKDGEVAVCDERGQVRMRMDGSSGMLHMQGADCAEEFSLEPGFTAIPGTLLVIDGEECLKPCAEPYDRRVAGVVSASPAITLGSGSKMPLAGSEVLLALAGRVACRVDASYAPIEIGDLLTTSPTLGHAMKVTDASLAFGAVIGKALRPLPAGQGLIPILVALQ